MATMFDRPAAMGLLLHSVGPKWRRRQSALLIMAAILVSVEVASLFTASLFAAEPNGSRVITLEEGWRFRLKATGGEEAVGFDDRDWATIRVPHQPIELSTLSPRSATAVWLRRSFELTTIGERRVVLHITQGTAFQVWLNGQAIGNAPGVTLLEDVTSLVRRGQNILALKTSVPGICGHVRLHLMPELHLDPRALRIDVPDWSGGPAIVRIRSEIENDSSSVRQIELRASVIDPDGQILTTLTTAASSIAPDATAPVVLSLPKISSVPLWSPETPLLCGVTVELWSDGQRIDRRTANFGFRWYHFEPDGPFSFNGQSLPVRGVVHVRPAVARYPVREELWRYEIGLLKDMGVNFVRPEGDVEASFYEACDRQGLLVTAPVHTERASAEETRAIVRELGNHPSILTWHSNGEGKDALVAERISRNTEILRAYEPSRPVLCCELGWRTPGTVGLVDTDIAGQGNYTGWYEGTLEHIGQYLDDYRALLRERYGRPLPVIVSNFGAAGDSSLHSSAPVRNDFSHEYLTAYHRRFYQEIMKRRWLAGGFIFCFRDLQSEQPIPRHTWKGVLDLKDQKKDPYFFYQSRWTKKPMVHVAQSSWTSRDLWPPDATGAVEVFSNCERVELFHDGRSLGTQQEHDDHFRWKVSCHAGDNVLQAVGWQGDATVETESRFTVSFRPPAVEPRLVSGSAANGSPARSMLTWDPVAGAEKYLIYVGTAADFTVSDGRLLATLTSTSFALDAPTASQLDGSENFPHYAVMAEAGPARGPLSRSVGLAPGSVQWKVHNPGWLVSSPALADLDSDGRPEIVMGSYDGRVSALRNDGSLLWSFDAKDPVLASPAIAPLAPGEPPAVVINSTKALFVLSHDGGLRWCKNGIRQFDRSIRSPTLTDLNGDQRLEILCGSDHGELLALDATGAPLWRVRTAANSNRGLSPTTCAVIDRPEGGRVLTFAADDGRLYLVDSEGRELWKVDTGIGDHAVGLPPNDLTPAAGSLTPQGAAVIVAGGARLAAFDLDGRCLWQREDRAGFPQISRLDKDGPRHVVVAAKRTLYALDHAGNDVWSYTLPHPRDYFLQPPASGDLDDDGAPDLAVGTRSTSLIALSGRGQMLWEFKSQDEITGSPAIGDMNRDGIVDVVFGSRDGWLYVLAAGRAPASPSESPTHRGSLHRTGAYGR